MMKGGGFYVLCSIIFSLPALHAVAMLHKLSDIGLLALHAQIVLAAARLVRQQDFDSVLGRGAMKMKLHGVPPWLRVIKVHQQCSINNPHVLGVDHDHGLIQVRTQERKVVVAVLFGTSQHCVFEHCFGPFCEALSRLTNLNETEHLHEIQPQQLKNLSANRAQELYRMSAGKSSFHQADVHECDSDVLCSTVHHGNELRAYRKNAICLGQNCYESICCECACYSYGYGAWLPGMVSS
jgi:hypothetical protein